MATKENQLRMPISLKGIDRRPNDALPDGALLDMINMRFTNGALRPVPGKVLVPDSPQFSLMYKHIISETVYSFWGTSGSYLAYAIYQNDVLVTQNLALQTITGEAAFSHVGNACMISDQEGEKTYVMLYDPDTQDYRSFDGFLPDMPLIQFQRVANTTDDETKVITLDAASTDDAIDTALKGSAQDQWKRMVRKGYLIGKYLVRCAWELFDGSIVMHTVPAFIVGSDIDGKWHAGASYWTTVKFTGYDIQYKINISSADLIALKTQYKGIVKSFNIYITNHAPLEELQKILMVDDDYYSMTLPAGYTTGMTNSWINNEIFYFQLRKIGIDSLTAETFANVAISDVSLLSSGDVMPAGNFSIHRLFGKRLFSYNQRIFMGNIKNTLYQGQSLHGLLYVGTNNVTGPAYSIAISYDIDTAEGTKRVLTEWEECTYYRDDGGGNPDYFQFTLRDFIGYPDARCKQCDMWFKIGADIRHIKTIPMNHVFGMNFSFAMPVNYFTLDTGLGFPKVIGPYTGYSIDSPEVSATYWDGDRVQATEFQNPFYFPAINSYRVDGFIMGMATNVIPLSQGQFGQFPIFTFTTRGIWTLDIGDGDILIQSVRPLSGTVCINAKSILGIDGGVIFLSNEGLMILAGRDPIGISDQAIGPAASPLIGLNSYDKIMNDPNVYRPLLFTDEDPFGTYAMNANVAFVNVNLLNATERKEIIVSNPEYNYSYVYNLTSKSWFRITQSWVTFIHDFPTVYGTDYANSLFNLYDITQELAVTDQEIMIHAETRPVKFGEMVSFKKIMRSILYGWINPGDMKPFTFYLFGSSDGEHWFVHSASHVVSPGEKVITGRSSFSCRSFIFVIGGAVKDDSYISGLIADIEKRYAMKLT